MRYVSRQSAVTGGVALAILLGVLWTLHRSEWGQEFFRGPSHAAIDRSEDSPVKTAIFSFDGEPVDESVELPAGAVVHLTCELIGKPGKFDILAAATPETAMGSPRALCMGRIDFGLMFSRKSGTFGGNYTGGEFRPVDENGNPVPRLTTIADGVKQTGDRATLDFGTIQLPREPGLWAVWISHEAFLQPEKANVVQFDFVGGQPFTLTEPSG